MNPSGKPAPFRCSVGLYFTVQPPVALPYKIKLTTLASNVPSNEEKFEAKDEFVLPGDVEVTRVHAGQPITYAGEWRVMPSFPTDAGSGDFL